MQLDWHDLKTNGCPALLRALKQIETTLNEQEHRFSQAEKAREILTTCQNRQEQALTDLQYLLSEEIMRQLLDQPSVSATPSTIVADLGSGWRIERRPANDHPAITMPEQPRTATPNQSYTWLPGDAWSQYCAAVDPGPCSAQGGCDCPPAED